MTHPTGGRGRGARYIGQHRVDGKLEKGVCVCERVQYECRKLLLRAKEEMCSGRDKGLPFLTRVGTGAREWKGNVFVNVSAGADTKANTSGGGAHEVGDLCLLEDGSEYSDALISDAVASETALPTAFGGQGGKR